MRPKLLFRFVVLAVLTTLSLAAQSHLARTAAQEQPTPKPDSTWFCPMHPDVTAAAPGKCWKCDMTLVAGNPFDTRDYELEVATSPVAIRAGTPFRLTMNVRHPGTSEVVKDYEVVHDRSYHLFVISEDMTSFQHVHPTKQTDGTWTLDVTVPKPGYYRVLSDFLPSGGGPQFLSRSLVTADFEGDAEAQAARLAADQTLTTTVGGLTASVSVQPERLLAGEYGHMTFTLQDAASGQPVTDLQPYLGAFGHMLMISEDMADYVHAHPTARPELDVARGAAGPYVQFEGYMPRPGLYRAWTQFQRAGQVMTVPFTFRVWSLEESVRAGLAGN